MSHPITGVNIFRENVVNKLSLHTDKLEGDTLGFLIGYQSKDKSCNIISCISCSTAQYFAEQVKKTQSLIPAGLEIYGIFYLVHSQPSPENVLRKCRKLIPVDTKDFLGSDKLLVLHIEHDNVTIDESSFYWYHPSNGQAENCEVNIVDDSHLPDEMMTFRIKANLLLQFDYMKPKDALESLSVEIEELCDKIASPSSAYHIENSSLVMKCDHSVDDVTVTEMSRETPCERILEHIYLEEDDDFDTIVKAKGGKKKGKNRSKASVESVNVHLLHQLSSSADDVPDCTPVIHCEQNDFTYTSIPLNIDVVVMTTKTTPVSQLPRLFSKGISNQLIAMEDCMLTYYQNEKFHIPESYHFSIPGFQHLLNVVYPRDKSEEELESHRRNLHTKLVIPLDKPLLRRTRRYVFTEERNKEGYLTNTHIGLPQSGDGQMYIVSGVYSYHHYMQDRIDDNGWGCAYRSLQTICSWFRHQGYVDRPVPTHKEIQQALVDVGDKPSKFVGSRQWIGSIEVSTCLDQLLGVTSKIMFVNNGTDLGNKGRELAVHFQTQGTPIMIGGGVLAHTILGVDFNEVTGQVKFLILDPHYTGGEDLKVIQDKGWCGWKSEEFWDKTAYYNLCMPQRPHVI